MVDRFFLAIETSQDYGSLALGTFQESLKKTNNQIVKLRKHQIITLKEWSSDTLTRASHSEFINQFCLDLLKENKITLSQLASLVVDIGPGSFTGVRVGVNFVRSLAYSLNIPILPVCSLAILANREFLKEQKVAEGMLPSLGNEFYYAKYQKTVQGWEELQPPELREQNLPCAQPQPWSAKDLADCAFTRLDQQECDWKALVPLYLRASQAEEKMKRTHK